MANLTLSRGELDACAAGCEHFKKAAAFSESDPPPVSGNHADRIPITDDAELLRGRDVGQLRRFRHLARARRQNRRDRRGNSRQAKRIASLLDERVHVAVREHVIGVDAKDEIVEILLDRAEPVRHPGRDDDDVARPYSPALPAAMLVPVVLGPTSTFTTAPSAAPESRRASCRRSRTCRRRR